MGTGGSGARGPPLAGTGEGLVLPWGGGNCDGGGGGEPLSIHRWSTGLGKQASMEQQCHADASDRRALPSTLIRTLTHTYVTLNPNRGQVFGVGWRGGDSGGWGFEFPSPPGARAYQDEVPELDRLLGMRGQPVPSRDDRPKVQLELTEPRGPPPRHLLEVASSSRDARPGVQLEPAPPREPPRADLLEASVVERPVVPARGSVAAALKEPRDPEAGQAPAYVDVPVPDAEELPRLWPVFGRCWSVRVLSVFSGTLTDAGFGAEGPTPSTQKSEGDPSGRSPLQAIPLATAVHLDLLLHACLCGVAPPASLS